MKIFGGVEVGYFYQWERKPQGITKLAHSPKNNVVGMGLTKVKNGGR